MEDEGNVCEVYSDGLRVAKESSDGKKSRAAWQVLPTLGDKDHRRIPRWRCCRTLPPLGLGKLNTQPKE